MAEVPDRDNGALSYCFVVPHYRHEGLLASLLPALVDTELPIIVVDDGSPEDSRIRLRMLAGAHASVQVLERADNGGKGAAVKDGIRYAQRLGYTHVIQIDADGQHDLGDLPDFLRASQSCPDAIVSGRPVFGDDAPLARRCGRQLTNFWIHIETLSNYIPDAMCGYRVYPVSKSAAMIAAGNIGPRMDFDIEFLVRAAWAGWPILFLPTQVNYSSGGVSHFRMVHDNIRITLLHVRLVTGMLLRLPVLLPRKLFPHRYPTGPGGNLNREFIGAKGNYIG